MRRRTGLVLCGLLVCTFVAMLGPASVASGGPVSSDPAAECNPAGRAFCVDVTTFSNITASDPSRQTDGKRYTWVEWFLTNTGGATLTNVKATVTMKDYDCSAYVPPAGDPERAPNPAAGDCGAALTQSSAFTAAPSGCTLQVSTQTLTCNYANLPAANPDVATPTKRAYFKTANLPATHSVITVLGTVKERGNDAGSTGGCAATDPNCDTHATSVVNSYEPDDNAAYTFVTADGQSFYLETNDKLSSYRFTADTPAPFRADFVVDAGACETASPTCFERTLNVTTVQGPTSYNDGPILFYARLSDAPSGVNANTVVAVHTYDVATFTVAANRFTPPAGMDARLDTVKIGSTTFFVVNVNTTTNTFQLAATQGGSPLDFVAGPQVGTPERIIGDQSFERSSKGCVFAYSNNIPVPSICGDKAQGLSQTIDAWVWDSHNGSNRFG